MRLLYDFKDDIQQVFFNTHTVWLISITGSSGHFLSLFQPNFLFNSAFEKDSSDLVLRQLKLGTNI